MRLLKKYPNRRIYDTQTSQFVALAEIRQMIVERQSIQVLHSKTGENLTRGVLMQIVTEMEQEGHPSLLTNRILEELIRFYGDKIMAMIAPHLEQQILQSLATHDKIREHLSTAFSQPFPTPEQAIADAIERFQTGVAQAPPAGGLFSPKPPPKRSDEPDES